MIRVTSNSPKQKVGATVRGQTSKAAVQKQARSRSCRSVVKTTAGSGAALTARTNFLDGPSVYAFYRMRNRSSAAASRLTPGKEDSLESSDALDLKFTTYFSPRGSWPGADASSIPPAAADRETTTPFGPCVPHFPLICCFMLDQVG